jgi:hypothetical protein
MTINRFQAAIIAGISIIGFSGIASIATAASGNGTTTVTECVAGVCSAGEAGSYTVTRAGNLVSVSGTSFNEGWRCNVQAGAPGQTRIECTTAGKKIIAQATVQQNTLVSKVVAR